MSLLLPCSLYYFYFYSCTFHKWLRLFFLKHSSGYIRTQFFKKYIFSVSTELYFSAVSIPPLKCIFNMLSNVFPILCYTKDMPYSFLLCVFGQFHHLKCYILLHLHHLESHPCLRGWSHCHLARPVPPIPYLSEGYLFFFWTSCDVVEHRYAHLNPSCEQSIVICLQCCRMSHALSIHIFAPGKREEHNSEQNRKTDTNKQIKTKIKHRETERQIII